MTLAENLLPKLAEHRPTSPGRFTWTQTDAAAGWAVALTIDKADALSYLLWEAAVTSAVPAGLDGPALKAKAAAICATVTGLMEPLKLVEVDEGRGEMILRSTAPTARSEKRSHYELTVTAAGAATLRRFQAGTASSAKREQVPFSLTHEVLGKFLDDVTDSLA